MTMNNSMSNCECSQRSAVSYDRLMMRSVLVLVAGVAVSVGAGCGSSAKSKGTGSGGGSSSGYLGGGGGSTSGSIVSGSSGAGTPPVSDASTQTSAPPAVCEDGGLCTCVDGGTTTITGRVLDPAMTNPLYNVTVFVEDPASPLPDLESAGLTCGCSTLYPASVLATSQQPTDATGTFQIGCAPSGTVTLVVQAGKWRMEYPNIVIQPGIVNQVPDMHLPGISTEGSLPHIAISTGGADSLECLPLRIGVDPSEYVMGPATGGHIHIYTGYGGATTEQGNVQSYETLWDSQADLNANDVVLLSCEGHETTGGNPGVTMTAQYQTFLENYVNAGGRAFASHFHYAWFSSGVYNTGASKLATWKTGGQQIDDSVSFPSDIDTTLASGAAFPEGAALLQWLGVVGALTNNQLPIWFARHNVTALVQPPSTEWIHLDPSVTQAPSASQYFAVDTPIGAGPSAVCGRIVFSDLHVSGGPGTNEPGVAADYADAGGGGGPGGGGGKQGGIVPDGCAMHPLTAQEDALEFMLFDLSSCLVPAGQAAPPPVIRIK